MILPGAIIGGGTLSAEFQGTGTNASNLTSYTFAGVNFGNQSTKRYILVAVSNVGGASATVTVDGVSATKIYSALSPEWWLVALPTGTSGDVVVATGGAAATRCSIAVWAVYHLKNLTPTDGDFINGVGNLSPRSIDVEQRGLILAVADGASGHTNITWTGITEVADVTIEARQFSAAWAQFSTAQTVSVGCTGNAAGIPITTIIALR